MTDLINRLRLQAEDLHVLNPASETVKCLSLGADEIERLNEEVLEQCRLNGMGSEREARLMARLAESQAREAKLASDVDRCLKMLLSDPDTVGALFKAENLLREALVDRHAEHTALDALLKAEQQWMPIDSAPKTGRTILLGYANSHGNWRTMRGQWFSQEAIDEEWDDTDDPDDLEGWYETSVESDDTPNCWPITPSHWMPLPAPPKGD